MDLETLMGGAGFYEEGGRTLDELQKDYGEGRFFTEDSVHLQIQVTEKKAGDWVICLQLRIVTAICVLKGMRFEPVDHDLAELFMIEYPDRAIRTDLSNIIILPGPDDKVLNVLHPIIGAPGKPTLEIRQFPIPD